MAFALAQRRLERAEGGLGANVGGHRRGRAALRVLAERRVGGKSPQGTAAREAAFLRPPARGRRACDPRPVPGATPRGASPQIQDAPPACISRIAAVQL